MKERRIRIPESLDRELEAQARRDYRSVNSAVVVAIQAYLAAQSHTEPSEAS